MLDKNHPAINPITENCLIWRYMDLPKFLSMLEDSCLHIPACSSFDDPFEGYWPKVNVKNRDMVDKLNWDPEWLTRLQRSAGAYPGTKDTYPQLVKETKREIFASCWYESDHESAAMWQSVSRNDSIAIRTSYDVLAEAIEKSPLTGILSRIQYIDYECGIINPHHPFCPYLCKRRDFSHEREIRALFGYREPSNLELFSNLSDIPKALTLEVDLNKFIQAVYVAPKAKSWFSMLVKKITERYGLKIPFHYSTLYDPPKY